MKITQADVKRVLRYEPETGRFFRIVPVRGPRKTGEAGCINSQGYRMISVRGERLGAHRLAWLYVHGCWPKEQIDHINHVRTDNRLANLREATEIENKRHRLPRHDSRTGVRGVTPTATGMYQARIRISGSERYLGCYATIEQARAVRLAAEREHYGLTT